MSPALALAALALTAPATGWTPAVTGPAGGIVWQGRIPNEVVPRDLRPSAVYLPPGYDPGRRYPVVYLLHGMRGSPSSIYRSLRLPTVADGLIASGQSPPFIAVLPVAGPTRHPDPANGPGSGSAISFKTLCPGWTPTCPRSPPLEAGRSKGSAPAASERSTSGSAT